MVQRLFGFVLVAVGLLFLVDTLGLAEAGDILRVWWPLILVVGGVFEGLGGSWLGGGILIVLGGAFMLRNLGLLPGEFVAAFWPLLIIGVGLYLLFYRRDRDAAAHGAPSVRLFSIFAGANHRLESQELRRAELSVMFGSLEVDARLAQLATDGAVVDVGVLAGSIQLRVPETWRVSPEALVLFGGIEDKRPRPGAQVQDAPRLVIRGFVAMGGVEVVS